MVAKGQRREGDDSREECPYVEIINLHSNFST